MYAISFGYLREHRDDLPNDNRAKPALHQNRTKIKEGEDHNDPEAIGK